MSTRPRPLPCHCHKAGLRALCLARTAGMDKFMENRLRCGYPALKGRGKVKHMNNPVTLHGYRFSVYHRIARMVLHEKGVEYEIEEIDPFSKLDPAYLKLHPFGRVPALTHGMFTVFETSAISRYIDNGFAGPPLQPIDSHALARMNQVIAVIDNYGYWPMVRQVFSHRVFRPLMGERSNEGEVAAGIEASHKVLSFLDDIAQERLVLDGKTITLADCHLAPMMDYFTRAKEGGDALDLYRALSRWWKRVSDTSMVLATAPMLVSSS